MTDIKPHRDASDTTTDVAAVFNQPVDEGWPAS
jgi:hypothetical protein